MDKSKFIIVTVYTKIQGQGPRDIRGLQELSGIVNMKIEEGYIPCGGHTADGMTGEYSIAMMLPSAMAPLAAQTIEMVEAAKVQRWKENSRAAVDAWVSDCEKDYGPGTLVEREDGSCIWTSKASIHDGKPFTGRLDPPQRIRD